MIDVQRIAIVDDETDSAEGMAIAVEDAGLEPVIVDTGFTHLSEIVPGLNVDAQAALCDHRLEATGYAPFRGAEAVSRLVKAKFPAILVTLYVDSDSQDSIRTFRRWIPVLLQREDLATRLIDGIAVCRAEISGIFLPQRKPRRALLRVEDVIKEGDRWWIDAVIPAWKTDRAVRLPAAMVPLEFREQLKHGMHLYAKVNLGAELQEDLYFDEFEMAPTPMTFGDDA
jgi:hypothetical protein